MNKSSKLLLLIVTAFLLASSIQVECRRTYSSRSSSSGRGNRGKNQPSGGVFSSWFGGSKSSSSGSGSISKPAPTSSKKNWQTASSHATSQSKPSSGWANPYYKPSGSAPVPSAPKETSYGWKPATGTNVKPVSSLPSSNIGSRGYPVQTGVQQTGTSFGGYKPASSVPGSTHYQPSQTGIGGYRPASNVPSTGYHPAPNVPSTGYHPAPNVPSTGYHPPSNVPSSGYHPAGHQTNYGGYSASNYHPSHGYQPSHSAPHQPSYNPTGGHYSSGYPQQTGFASGGYHAPSYSGYSPHASFGGAAPSYQGTKLFGGSSGHYGYPGSGSWGIDSYGSRKSSGTGKLLTGLAVGAAGGYLTSSLINRISNPWKYSGYGYGSPYGYGVSYGGGHDYVRVRDESAFERGYERGIQAKLNENNNNNNNNKDSAAPPEPEDPTSKWIQCVAFDPQTQQTLINPNCSCTVTTSVDERTGQPLSVHHCTTLNGLVMRPIPVQPGAGTPINAQSLGSVNGQPAETVNGQPLGDISTQSFGGQPAGGVNEPIGVSSLGGAPSYFPIAYGNDFQYNGGATVYIPPRAETKLARAPTETKPDAITDKSTTETRTEQSATEPKPEQSTAETNSETSTGTVTEQEVTARVQSVESVAGGNKSEAPPTPEELAGGLGENQKRTAEFYGQLQKIVNMGSFVDGG